MAQARGTEGEVSVNFEEWVEGLDLSVLGRGASETEQAVRDVELLWWIGRFRFVTGEAIGERLGISWQRANSRVRRLERLGLLGSWQRSVCEPRAVFLTGRAMELFGQPRRRAPRPDVQREHEAAIVWLSTQLELERPDARVLTERECRRADRDTDGEKLSVEVYGTGSRRDRTRWPDLVCEHDGVWEAFEIEFAPKGKARLEGIVGAYARNFRYRRVTFFVRNAALGRTLSRLVQSSSVQYAPRKREWRVLAWPGLAEPAYGKLSAELSPPRPSRSALKPEAAPAAPPVPKPASPPPPETPVPPRPKLSPQPVTVTRDEQWQQRWGTLRGYRRD